MGYSICDHHQRATPRVDLSRPPLRTGFSRAARTVARSGLLRRLQSPPRFNPGPDPALSEADRMRQVREHTCVAPAPLVPEIRLYQADTLVPLWEATEWHAASPQPPPFWAFAWPGSIVLARYLLDTPWLARDRRILDFGSGSGLAAIAARLAGAAEVVAYDLDPLATVAQRLNAALNAVEIVSMTGDATQSEEHTS